MLGAVHQRLGELEAKSLAQRIPPLPRSLDAILRELDREEATTWSVGKIVASDPVLAGRILRMARSGFYSRGREVKRVDEAVARLGLRTTRNLALAASLRQIRAPEHLVYGTDGFFLHCFTTAHVAVGLARARRLDSDIVFLAGLMHDVGLLVETMDYDHAAVGRVIAQHWKLPAEVGQIIADHHEPDEDPSTRAVHFADLACEANGVGLPGPVDVSSDDPMFAEAMDLVPEALELAQDAYRALQ
ncbi:MAG: HDOD domain-containing protein [Alphaproteobacteria bacterium]|nr:HDOD domain-containing protein [Alphaproteobacteria bacterium]